MTRPFNILWFSIAVGGMTLAGCGTNGDAATVDQTPAAEIAERVKNAPDEQARDQAVKELARRGETALPEIRKVISESESPAVRVPLVKALAVAKDYDGIEQLLDLLDDNSADVRRESDEALQQLFGINVHYDAEAAEPERQDAIARYRYFWKRNKDTNLCEWGKHPEKARQSLEKRIRFQ